MTDNALAIITPQQALDQAKAAYEITKQMYQLILRPDLDYGTIPGTQKPTLYKPGAEKLCAAFGYAPRFETLDKVEKWDDENPLFHYRMVCHLIRLSDGKEIASGNASCNSKETRYRWRWVDEAGVPAGTDKSKLATRKGTLGEFKFAIDKAETTGKYGKPASYWAAWKKALADGTVKVSQKELKNGKQADFCEMGGIEYRIPNEDVFSLVNTIEKMSCKRALIAAVLIGTGASEFFTQDMEDLKDFSVDFLEGDIVDVLAEAKGLAASQTPLTREQFVAEMKKLNFTDEPTIGLFMKANNLVRVDGERKFNIVLEFAKSTNPEPILEKSAVIIQDDIKDVDKLAEGLKQAQEAAKNGAGMEKALETIQAAQHAPETNVSEKTGNPETPPPANEPLFPPAPAGAVGSPKDMNAADKFLSAGANGNPLEQPAEKKRTDNVFGGVMKRATMKKKESNP